jgi:RNA ligase (TIGR02306 family)
MTRKLVSIQEIQEIRPIEGADAICHYRINDWWIVDRINQYNVGQLICFAEIDSFIPHDAFPSLSKGKEPKVYKGIKGERLRTIKLRGALSQGLLLPTSIVKDREFTIENIGEDVTEILGVVKWELELPAQLAGQVNGTFPNFIPKTDQERAQNLKAQIFQSEDTWTPVQNEVDQNTIDRLVAANKFRYNGEVLERFSQAQAQPNARYEITMKMDGSSITNYFDPNTNQPCVASRNFALKVNDDTFGGKSSYAGYDEDVQYVRNGSVYVRNHDYTGTQCQ